jgi:hypothetical protein
MMSSRRASARASYDATASKGASSRLRESRNSILLATISIALRPLPLGVLPRAAAQPAVDADTRALREVLAADLGLAVPRRDVHEVRARVTARPVDREQERRDLLLRPDVLELDVGRQVADQVHAVQGCLLVCDADNASRPRDTET